MSIVEEFHFFISPVKKYELINHMMKLNTHFIPLDPNEDAQVIKH